MVSVIYLSVEFSVVTSDVVHLSKMWRENVPLLYQLTVTHYPVLGHHPLLVLACYDYVNNTLSNTLIHPPNWVFYIFNIKSKTRLFRLRWFDEREKRLF